MTVYSICEEHRGIVTEADAETPDELTDMFIISEKNHFVFVFHWPLAAHIYFVSNNYLLSFSGVKDLVLSQCTRCVVYEMSIFSYILSY